MRGLGHPIGGALESKRLEFRSPTLARASRIQRRSNAVAWGPRSAGSPPFSTRPVSSLPPAVLRTEERDQEHGIVGGPTPAARRAPRRPRTDRQSLCADLCADAAEGSCTEQTSPHLARLLSANRVIHNR